MSTLSSHLSNSIINEDEESIELLKLSDLTVDLAKDLIYRLGFTAKDIAMRIKSAPTTKEVSDVLKNKFKISPIRLSNKDYILAKEKHIARLNRDERFNVNKIREDLLSGMTAPNEIMMQYNLPHRQVREILVEMIEDYDTISRKCSSMRAISRSNAKSKQLKIAESSSQLKELLKDLKIDLSSSARFAKDLRDKIEYQDVEFQKSVIRRYFEIVGRVRYPEDQIFEVIRFSLANKNYIELLNENILDFDKSIFYRPMSLHEEDVLSLLKSYYQKEILINDRKVLNGKELDFYLPSIRLAIEVNPIFTHNSNLYRNNHHGWRHDDNYHFQKYQMCKDTGIELIQLQEYDLQKDRFEEFTKPFLINKLSSKFKKIYARECKFVELTTEEAKEFLEYNHRDGYVASKYKFGLMYNDELVAVATVSKSSNRFKRTNDMSYELVRLAYRKDLKIIGATSKFIKNIFKSINEMNELVTFSDNDYGNGESYLKSGFEFVNETGPRLRYISTTDPAKDRYSWQIAKGFKFNQNDKTVVAKDAKRKNMIVENVAEYIETTLSHRTDHESGYNRLFTSGSKKWKITRNEVLENGVEYAKNKS